MISAPQQQAGFPSCVNLSIEFNAHALYYQTVEAWVADQDEGTHGWFSWVSEAEQRRAMATNSVWTCQWYPETPVGFCALAASSFETLMAAVNARSRS